MERGQLKDYIETLLNDPTAGEEPMKEVPNIFLLLSVYQAGLQKHEFPVHDLLIQKDLKDFPPEFHTLIGECAILKSSVLKGRGIPRDYLLKDCKTRFSSLKSYFSNPL